MTTLYLTVEDEVSKEEQKTGQQLTTARGRSCVRGNWAMSCTARVSGRTSMTVDAVNSWSRLTS